MVAIGIVGIVCYTNVDSYRLFIPDNIRLFLPHCPACQYGVPFACLSYDCNLCEVIELPVYPYLDASKLGQPQQSTTFATLLMLLYYYFET